MRTGKSLFHLTPLFGGYTVDGRLLLGRWMQTHVSAASLASVVCPQYGEEEFSHAALGKTDMLACLPASGVSTINLLSLRR